VPNYNLQTISELPALDRSKLHRIWQELFPQPAPARLRREWLVRILAYRIQERLYGELKPELQRELIRVGQALERNPNAANFTPNQAGTQFVREWNGVSHTVTSADDGRYEYRGKRYKSLSEIARLITGTRWSGPLFFGRRKKQRGAR